MVSYAQRLNNNWSWTVQAGIINTFGRTFQQGIEERPEINSFMDIRRMREQEELVATYFDPEYGAAYENQGLGLINKSPTTYSNKYIINGGLKRNYVNRSKWLFSFGVGFGLGMSYNSRIIGGGSIEISELSNEFFDGIIISEEFLHRWDHQRLEHKLVLFNSYFDHILFYRLSDKIYISQYIGYNYDFLGATGLGGERLNLGTAGILNINLGIQINL